MAINKDERIIVVFLEPLILDRWQIYCVEIIGYPLDPDDNDAFVKPSLSETKKF